MDEKEDSEKSHLIIESMYSLKQKRLGYPNLPFTNADESVAVELRKTAGAHCHGNRMASRESREKKLARKKLCAASIVCLVFMIGEVVGGYLAHSLAIMTDAAHLLTDFCSMLVSLFSLWVSSRPPTKTMSFGWHRSGLNPVLSPQNSGPSL
ncbi:hypothetical protein AAFF_G00410990 [Aldrovandia affinis]|uniref:Probable proton-coupled zinc antiporter SLC30A3 n=1 Tax=Aldrovandia affinis TaxID=143900 RepID=A0AAD7WJN0_9TELE|nr:hypothetical protein AAFF_G00410990 [Aldrovandia affinis]